MQLPLAIVRYDEWAALGILFVLAAGFAIFNVVAVDIAGAEAWRATTKDTPYRISGVNPVGDTRQRFNVRFYLVAMIFLVFDVEVLFLIPWLTIFPEHVFNGYHLAEHGIVYGALFVSVLTFSAIILVAYFYAWGKGVLKWD